MLIGEVVQQTGISRDTIRYYERLGLLQTGKRASAANNYKDYPPATVARLTRIQQAKKLGFSLAEIAEGLSLLETEQLSDVEAENRLVAKIAVVDEKLRALQAIRRSLAYTLEQLQNGGCSLPLPRAERAAAGSPAE